MIITSSLLLLAAQSSFTVTNSSFSGPVERPAHARLVWSDEFNGGKLDTAKWHYDTAFNKKGWFNKELQYYSANRLENLRVANGVLTIYARHETLDPAKCTDWGGQNYTSGRITRRAPAGLTASTKSGRSCPARAAPGPRSGCFPST